MTTATGTAVREGIVAADPALLPLGTIIHVDGLGYPYRNLYRVADTGAAIRGHRIDVYMRDCHEARAFGRRAVVVTAATVSDLP